MSCHRCGGPTASEAAGLCPSCFASPAQPDVPEAEPMLTALRDAYAPGPVISALRRAREAEVVPGAAEIADRLAPGRRVTVDDFADRGLPRPQAAALAYAMHRELGDERVEPPTWRDAVPTPGGAARWVVAQTFRAFGKFAVRVVLALAAVVGLLVLLR